MTITQASLEVITTNKSLEDENKLSDQQMQELQDLRVKITTLEYQNQGLLQQQQEQKRQQEVHGKAIQFLEFN